MINICFVYEKHHNTFKNPPTPLRLSPYKIDLTPLRPVIDKLQVQGVIRLILPTEEARARIHPIFGVPKTSGGTRFVIDLRATNNLLEFNRFNLGTPQEATAMVESGDWMTRLDLEDAFFHTPIYASHQKYLGFTLDNKLYCFTVLPFGLSPAPIVFSKLIREGLKISTSNLTKLKTFPFIDDILICWKGKPEQPQLSTLLDNLQGLGFKINWKKSHLTPTTSIDYLGITVDSIQMEMTPTEARRTQIAMLIRNTLNHHEISL